MKRIILAVIFGVASLSSISTKAQINLDINIGSQPLWGPTGYNHVEYYYLPDIDAYYNVPNQEYLFLENGRWTKLKELPAKYRNYDLYRGYKVVINSDKPYLSHNDHVKKYSKYKGKQGKQAVIRDSKDAKYVNARRGRGSEVKRTNRNANDRSQGEGRGNAPREPRRNR